MKKPLLFTLAFMISGVCFSQIILPPSGANQKSIVKQYMGAHAYVKVVYNSPDVTGPRGEDRSGQIWGQLVPYGLSNLNFGISTDENPSPWRAGANENTVIHFSHDVLIEGQALKSGTYGLHMIPRENEKWTVIFSKNNSAWGSYFYRPEEDALRVDVQPYETHYTEWLTFEFTDRQENACKLEMKWDNLSVPIGIALENPTEIYLSHIREQMQSSTGFNWVNRNNAANYCMQNDVNLEEAYEWQKVTVSNPFMGSENITTLQTLAMLELKLNMEEEASATLEKAVNHPTCGVFQAHQLGRQLIALNKADLALDVFKMNLERNGDVWPVNVGLARGYSATGDYTKAIEHATKALERAPDQVNKDNLTRSIAMLKEGKDIN